MITSASAQSGHNTATQTVSIRRLFTFMFFFIEELERTLTAILTHNFRRICPDLLRGIRCDLGGSEDFKYIVDSRVNKRDMEANWLKWSGICWALLDTGYRGLSWEVDLRLGTLSSFMKEILSSLMKANKKPGGSQPIDQFMLQRCLLLCHWSERLCFLVQLEKAKKDDAPFKSIVSSLADYALDTDLKSEAEIFGKLFGGSMCELVKKFEKRREVLAMSFKYSLWSILDVLATRVLVTAFRHRECDTQVSDVGFMLIQSRFLEMIRRPEHFGS